MKTQVDVTLTIEVPDGTELDAIRQAIQDSLQPGLENAWFGFDVTGADVVTIRDISPIPPPES